MGCASAGPASSAMAVAVVGEKARKKKKQLFSGAFHSSAIACHRSTVAVRLAAAAATQPPAHGMHTSAVGGDTFPSGRRSLLVLCALAGQFFGARTHTHNTSRLIPPRPR